MRLLPRAPHPRPAWYRPRRLARAQEGAHPGIEDCYTCSAGQTATLGNFISGCTTILGAIITYSIEVSPGVEGVILSAGAGVYLYVAMTELGPMVTDLPENGVPLDSIKRLLAFAIGAILLGLILLDHEHCGGKHSGRS